MIKIKSGKEYLNKDGFDINSVFLCYRGKQELVIECPTDVLEELNLIEFDTFFPQLKEIEKFFKAMGYEYKVDIKGTPTKI